MPNPHNLSEFDKLPKFHQDLARAREAVQKEKDGLAATGKSQWERSHPQNHRYVPMAVQNKIGQTGTQHMQGASVAIFKKQNLAKDEWVSAYLELARTVKDDLVVGKPALVTYFKTVKAEDKNQEFTGTKALLKVIS